MFELPLRSRYFKTWSRGCRENDGLREETRVDVEGGTNRPKLFAKSVVFAGSATLVFLGFERTRRTAKSLSCGCRENDGLREEPWVNFEGCTLLPKNYSRNPWFSHLSGRWYRFAAPVALVFAASCGGGTDIGITPPPPPVGGTPAGSFAVTVSATTTTGAPVVTKSVALTLNVTR